MKDLPFLYGTFFPICVFVRSRLFRFSFLAPAVVQTSANATYTWWHMAEVIRII